MEYNYYPNTIDLELAKQKKIDYEFELLQKKYIESLEFYIMQKIDIKKYELMITQFSDEIVEINDVENNIYKKCSFFQNGFFYLRNNIHIERLPINQISEIQNAIFNNSILPFEFIKNTVYLLINEGVSKINYGYNNLNDYFEPNIFIFEFSYFAIKIKDAKSYIDIKEHIEDVANKFCQEFNEKFDCKSTYRIYTGIPLLFEVNDIKEKVVD